MLILFQRSRLDRLLLSDKNTDLFLKALSFVAIPAVILKYHVDKLYKACKMNSADDLKLAQNTILTDVYINLREFKNLQGPIFNDIKEFKAFFQNIKSNNTGWVKTTEPILNVNRENPKNVHFLLKKQFFEWSMGEN